MRYIIITAFAFFFLISCKNKNKNKISRDADSYYTCSMHPQIIADKPGKCPICKMELTLVKKKSNEKNGEIHRIRIQDVRF